MILEIGGVNSDQRPFRVATSTGQRNILFSNYREGDVDYEVQTEILLHRRSEGIDVGPPPETDINRQRKTPPKRGKDLRFPHGHSGIFELFFLPSSYYQIQ